MSRLLVVSTPVTPSADGGENKDQKFSEICAKKELDGKVGLREKS